MKNYKHYHGSNISFIDMLFNIIIAFVLMFFIAIMYMNPAAKKKDLEAKADIIITMSWPDNNPHDIDLWLKPPEGSAIYYSAKENSFIFLDRDDLGASNNFIIKDGVKEMLATRREVISFRGKMSGRYVVNSVFYMAKTESGVTLDPSTYVGTPVPVTIEMVQINPVYKIIAKKNILLSIKEEKTAFSFIIRDEEITDIDLETEEKFAQSSTGFEGGQ